MATVHRIRPVIGLDQENVPKLCAGAQLRHDSWNENVKLLGVPSIDLPTFQDQITETVDADQAVKTTKNARPLRKAKVGVLWSTLEVYRGFLQQLCDAHPDQASVYISSANFQQAQVGEKQRYPLTAEATTAPGEVLLVIYSPLLVTPANKPYARRTHFIRHSLDGGKTFVNDEATSASRAVVSGLPPMVEILFQVAAKDRSGTSAYSTSVPITLVK